MQHIWVQRLEADPFSVDSLTFVAEEVLTRSATVKSSSEPPTSTKWVELAFALALSSFSFLTAAALDPKENLFRKDRIEGSIGLVEVEVGVVDASDATGACRLSGAGPRVADGLVPADMLTGENERAGVVLDSKVPEISKMGLGFASLLLPSGATAVRLDSDWLREERAENISSLAYSRL